MKNRKKIHLKVYSTDIKYLLIFIIFLIFQSTYAQQWRVFTTANSPLPTNTIGTIVIDTNNIKWIGTANGMVKIDGNNWQIYDTNNTVLPTNSIYPRDIDNFNNVWVTLPPQYGIAKFNGFTWTVYDTSNSGIPANSNVTLSVDNNNVKWICTPGIIRFDDINWAIYNTTNSGLPNNVVTTVAFESHIKWIGTFGLSSGMAKFNDTNWVIYNTGNSQIPSNAINQIKIDYLGNKWICTYAGGLAKFNSVTNTWTIYDPSNSGIPSYYIDCITFRNNFVKFIGTEVNGVSVFDDTVWQVFNESNSPLPSDFINDIKIDKYNNVWIATSSGLAIYNPDTIIGIKNNNTQVAKDFELNQNFPNPFNPTTNIKYQLTNNALVILNVFDVQGKEIISLVNQRQNKGTYEIQWDASNLPSGVYFYQLKANNYIETRKMILIK